MEKLLNIKIKSLKVARVQIALELEIEISMIVIELKEYVLNAVKNIWQLRGRINLYVVIVLDMPILQKVLRSLSKQ